MKRFATRRAIARSCAALLLAALAVPAAAGAAPTAEEVRACVEGNLARYSDPGTAVAAQYADAEATCRAALEEGSVIVEFEPGGGSGDESAAAAGAADPGGSDRGGAAPESPAADAAPTPAGAPGAKPGDQASAPTAAEAGSAADLVAQALAEADAGAGFPLPTSVSDGPGWMLALLGGAALLVGGAAVLAVRRRLN